MNEVLSAKSWKYFSQVAVEDGEEAQVVVLEGHQVGEMQRPEGIRRFIGIVPDGPRGQLQGKALQT